MTHKIRVHTARMETKYGTDIASVIYDPVLPEDIDNIVEELMGKLNYTENEDDDSYPGNCDGVGAYFSYDGYIDFEIPESIVKRIMDKDIEGVSI